MRYDRNMNLRDYFYGLSPAERDAFADRAGTSAAYLTFHLIPSRRKPDRFPHIKLQRRLVAASKGGITLDAVRTHFDQYQAA